MGGLVAIAGEPAVLFVQLGDLNGTATLVVSIAAHAAAPARMREIKEIRAVAADHDIAVVTLCAVVKALTFVNARPLSVQLARSGLVA
jgi:hypothetical protein